MGINTSLFSLSPREDCNKYKLSAWLFVCSHLTACLECDLLWRMRIRGGIFLFY